MKDLKFTLYEIVGFLFPGYFSLAGLLLIYWGVFAGELSPALPTPESWAVFCLSFVAYVLGHLVQGIANLGTAKLTPEYVLSWSSRTDSKGGNSDLVIEAARQEVVRLLGGSSEGRDIDLKTLYVVCDQYLAQKGATADQEMYMYREGFYRGITGAIALLSVGLLVKGALSLCIGNICVQMTRGQTFCLAVALLGATWIAFNRFKRFLGYRVRNAISAFLVLRAATAGARDSEKTNE